MGRRVLRAHVDDHGLVVGLLDVDVVGVDDHALGQPQDGARLAAQLVRAVRSGGKSSWAPSDVSISRPRSVPSSDGSS